ncbi:MAG: hypothetical protein RLZ35_302 [Pseudomonadota bacterium]
MFEDTCQTHLSAAKNALDTGNFSQLVQSLLTCLKNNPTDPSLHNDLAKAYLKLGDRHAAKRHFIEALHLNPHRIETLYAFARFHRQEGHVSESIRYFQKALRINPLSADTHYQLAHTYATQNQFDLALTHYLAALQYGIEGKNIHQNIGMLYFNEQTWEKAIFHLQKAFDEAPNDLIGLPLGQALLNMGQIQLAEHVYRQIIKHCPSCHDAHHNLAILYLKNQDSLAAKRHFKVALALQPDNATAQHMLTALSPSKKSPPKTAPLSYTSALFNQYAPYYNQHMKALKCDVPLVIRNTLGQLFSTQTQPLRVLDLGCGTGQCGLYCRDLAYHLSGVDISEEMLRIAKKLGAYDNLIECSIAQYLEETEETFDIIIAAEVLNYVGDLSKLWQSILKALNPKGCFIFTTEHPSQTFINANTHAYYLEKTGRFSHNPDAIQTDITAHPELFIKTYQDLTLRKSDEMLILGRLWCVSKYEKE